MLYLLLQSIGALQFTVLPKFYLQMHGSFAPCAHVIFYIMWSGSATIDIIALGEGCMCTLIGLVQEAGWRVVRMMLPVWDFVLLWSWQMHDELSCLLDDNALSYEPIMPHGWMVCCSHGPVL